METLARAANRGSVSTGGYDIEYSVKNEQDNGERFQSTNLGTPSSTKIFTFSMWVKRTEIINRHFLHKQYNTGISMDLAFANDSSTQALFYVFQNSTTDAYGKTTALFRDTSAWYHIVWRVDTTQATAADRVRIYVNGVQQDLESGNGSASTYPSQNYDVPLQTTHYLLGFGGSDGFCGYCSQYYYIDGQSLAPTDFGEFDSATGIWKPIEYTGTFGNAGYYLDFADASALGKDVGNSKGNFSHYGGSSADQALDTPTNNFCVVNAHSSFLLRDATGITEGATRIAHTNENTWCGAITTMGVTKGKWYWEVVINDFDDQMLGVTTFTGDTGSNTHPYQIDHTWNIYGGGSSGSYWISHINGTTTGNSSNRGAVWSAGSYIGVALDMDNSTLSFYHNGTLDSPNNSSIDISSLTALGHPLIPYVNVWRNAMWLNFGGYWSYPTAIASGNTDENGYGNFEYAPPSGYYALCSKNLAEFG